MSFAQYVRYGKMREKEGMAYEVCVKVNDGDGSIDFVQGAEDR